MRTSRYLTAMAMAALPSLTWGFELPSCGAANCLEEGKYLGCDPADLGCLCVKDQEQVNEFVSSISPCLYAPERVYYCTDGAFVQYEALLIQVCAEFGKTVDF